VSSAAAPGAAERGPAVVLSDIAVSPHRSRDDRWVSVDRLEPCG
jgi:hypothetical protein